ncbi:DUF2845 domain-containing protein [Rheinheimera aquimaris]|jgi:hypothetical protein|uniref:DUF2845 domain-containing protein n=1 Tax=Rheinheimera aquimaris TaxID=412437 RepID=UPI000E970F04|nr:DUF2845 domain-containing protein [Rheinheimera aquimaris]MCD1599326.1 DUF2845 domain-containing protein [Rheinheimera aquimaris]HBN89026.1 hypothetical protein [Rheinheimera sp.]|tara:strand:+ start:284 stop:598 length:315 start_codon:yes stop_codon:yes gene_type:complete
MKWFLMTVVALTFSIQATACGFRLDDGKLLRCGMKRIDVIALAGEPVSKDVDTLGVDTGEPVKGETIETWSYRLQGDIGGEYLVSLTLKAGKVVAINSKQLERI